jgi:hypothetical protein
LKKEIAIGAVLMAVSLAFFAATWSFPIEGQYVSPRVFPRFVTACMMILAAILVFKNIKQIKAVERKTEHVDEAPFSQRSLRFISDKRLFFGFALFAFVYTRVVDHLGFVISTLLLLAGTVIAFKERRWYVVVAVSLLGTSAFYYVFRMIFKVPLPRFDLF